jgi:hypothetical protein
METEVIQSALFEDDSHNLLETMQIRQIEEIISSSQINMKNKSEKELKKNERYDII